jgi:hypothetical protein
MTTAINWEPFFVTLQLFVAFVLICFLAAASDIWFKGLRRPKARASRCIAKIHSR